MLTTAQIAEMAGVDILHLNRWVQSRIAVPDMRGKRGRGQYHLFSRMRAVGVLVALDVWDSAQSCSGVYAREVCQTFGTMKEKELQRRLKKEGTHFAGYTAVGEVALVKAKVGEAMGWPDVEAYYRGAVKAEGETSK